MHDKYKKRQRNQKRTWKCTVLEMSIELKKNNYSKQIDKNKGKTSQIMLSAKNLLGRQMSKQSFQRIAPDLHRKTKIIFSGKMIILYRESADHHCEKIYDSRQF
jgi:hypothetical protein